jgi:hypothetical protein
VRNHWALYTTEKAQTSTQKPSRGTYVARPRAEFVNLDSHNDADHRLYVLRKSQDEIAHGGRTS